MAKMTASIDIKNHPDIKKLESKINNCNTDITSLKNELNFLKMNVTASLRLCKCALYAIEIILVCIFGQLLCKISIDALFMSILRMLLAGGIGCGFYMIQRTQNRIQGIIDDLKI